MAMSKEELIAKIIEKHDQDRLEAAGGYPSEYIIENDKVYWADYDPGKEFQAVTLGVWLIDKFIEEYEYVLDMEPER
jgi:hypothetical protein